MDMTKREIAELAAAETVAREASKAAYAALVVAPKGPDGHGAYVAWMQADAACQRAIKAHTDAVLAARPKAKAQVLTDCNTGRQYVGYAR